MFTKKKKAFSSDCDTLVGVNTVFEGNIQSEGTLRVDGKVKGDLTVQGDVFIGSTASVTGNITAGNVHLSGSVEGNIRAKGILRLMATARLYGDIQVNSFVADEGGVFQGKCSMFEANTAPGESRSESHKKSGKDYKKSAVLNEDTNTVKNN